MPFKYICRWRKSKALCAVICLHEQHVIQINFFLTLLTSGWDEKRGVGSERVTTSPLFPLIFFLFLWIFYRWTENWSNILHKITAFFLKKRKSFCWDCVNRTPRRQEYFNTGRSTDVACSDGWKEMELVSGQQLLICKGSLAGEGFCL